MKSTTSRSLWRQINPFYTPETYWSGSSLFLTDNRHTANTYLNNRFTNSCSRMKKHVFLLISALAVIGVSARVMDHTPNFAPITALALVAGYYLPRRASWLVPMAAMWVSDAIIGFYSLPVMAAVYGSFLLAWLFGTLASSSKSVTSFVPATLAASILFFLVTNAAVWAFTDMYVKTSAGLMQSYTMALPFFKWSLISDVLYTTVFVALAEAVLARSTVTKSAVEMTRA